jgi:hypothetical protein
MSKEWIVKTAMSALAIAGLVLILASFAGVSDAQETIVRVEPSLSELSDVGDEFSVDVVIEGVTNLAAFQFTLEFDSSVLKATAVEEGAFLGSSGREPLCPDAGKEILAGSAKLACVTLGAPVSSGGEPGPDGAGVLGTVEFTATGKGETSLGLQDVKLVEADVDDAGESIPIPTATENGEVAVAVGGGFAWVLWGPVIGVAAIILAAIGLAGWRRRAQGL